MHLNLTQHWKSTILQFFLLILEAYGRCQARGRIRAAAPSLRHSHGNTGSELHLQTTLRLEATPDPSPTEQEQRVNVGPHRDNIGSITPWATTGTPYTSIFLKKECQGRDCQTLNPAGVLYGCPGGKPRKLTPTSGPRAPRPLGPASLSQPSPGQHTHTGMHSDTSPGSREWGWRLCSARQTNFRVLPVLWGAARRCQVMSSVRTLLAPKALAWLFPLHLGASRGTIPTGCVLALGQQREAGK